MSAAPTDIVGARDALCHQEMFEQLGLTSFYAGKAQQFIEVGDQAAVDYMIKRAIVHLKTAILARNHLMVSDAEAP
jgi:hypothetical protein